jgi:cytochrome c-type biogenesis protein CcmH
MRGSPVPGVRGLRWLPVVGLLLLGLVALGLTRAAQAVDATDLGDPKLQARYLALTHELRCMQCQNESIADSPVNLASDLRRQVREMLLAGKSDDDVRSYMVARYGDFILFRPRFIARNLWLWAAPFVLLLIGAAAAVPILRQRAALLPHDNDPVEDP